MLLLLWPDFNHEVVREGVVTVGPKAEARLQVECQGSMEYVVSLFWVVTIEE